MPAKAAAARQEQFKFTADMIGSEVLERFSKDIYNPKAIIRELVSNANDSYSQLNAYLTEAGDHIEVLREVRVNVADNSVVVADDGLGMSRDDINTLVSIALTDKRDMAGVRGYRGIGFWSAYTGGEQIVVETTKLGDSRRYRLTLNTKHMRGLQRPNTSIGSIMNDPNCVRLESESADRDDHGTTVIIIAETDEGRLHQLVNAPEQMKAVLLEGCACRLPEEISSDPKSGLYRNVADFMREVSVAPPRLKFQGIELYKTFPGNLQGYATETIEMDIGNRRFVLAQLWYATNQENERLEGPTAGIRLLRDGFPIGKRNLDSDRDIIGSGVELPRQDLLDWHCGEVHLLHNELRPDASGEGLPDSAIYHFFRERLRAFYKKLMDKSYAKQRTKTLRTDYAKDLAFCATIQKRIDSNEDTFTADDVKRISAISIKIDADKSLARCKLPEGTSPGEKKSYVRDDEAAKLRGQLSKALARLSPHLAATAEAESAAKPAAKASRRRATKAASTGRPPANDAIETAVILSMIDEIRDAVVDVLNDEGTLQQELLTRINQIVSTLGR